MAKPPRPRKADAKPAQDLTLPEPVKEVPAENIELIRSSLGIDVSENPQQLRQAVVGFTASISHSPYPSGEMLASYRDNGYPELAHRIIEVVDEQRAHRMTLEKTSHTGEERRKNTGQISAIILGFGGAAGALVANHFGVSAWLCAVVAAICIGGPNTATIVARLLDRGSK